MDSARSSVDGSLGVSLSASYLARRLMRQQQQGAAAGGGTSNGMLALSPSLTARTYTQRQNAQSNGGDGTDASMGLSGGVDTSRTMQPNGSSNNHTIVDLDYKLEALTLMVTAFKTKVRSELDSALSSLDRSLRSERRELLTHVSSSLEESESRLASSLKTSLADYQALEMEFRKNMKLDLYTLRGDMETAVREEETVRAELKRRLKLQESNMTEVKAKLDELLVGRTGLLGPGINGSGSALGLHYDQQLLSFQHALDNVQSKLELDLVNGRKESEMKGVELSQQILDLRRVIDALVNNEEANQRASAEAIRAQGERTAAELQARVDESMGSMNTLLKNLYRNLDQHAENQDALHAQLSELQARDSATAPAQHRRVTHAQLSALEERLMSLINGPQGVATAATQLRELSTSVADQGRRLDQMVQQSRDHAEQSEMATRVAVEKLRQEMNAAMESRIDTLALEHDVLKRKVEMAKPEVMAAEMQRTINNLEKELSSKLASMREDNDRTVRALQSELSGLRERSTQVERRNEELVGQVTALDAQLRDVTRSYQDQLNALQTDAGNRDKKQMEEAFQLRDKHTTDIHTLRRELEESMAARDRRLQDEFSAAHNKVAHNHEDRLSELSTRLDSAIAESKSDMSMVVRTLTEENTNGMRRLEAEVRRLTQAATELDDKMKQLATANSQRDATVTAAAQAQVEQLSQTLSTLKRHHELLSEQHAELAKSVTESADTQSTLQSQMNAIQRDVEYALHATKQAETEASRASSKQAEKVKMELQEIITKIEARTRAELSECKLKLDDMEDSLKISQKYGTAAAAATAPLSSTSASSHPHLSADVDSSTASLTPSSSAPSSLSGMVRESSFRPLQRLVSALELEVEQLTAWSAAVKGWQNESMARTNELEQNVDEMRQRARVRELQVDEVLAMKLDVSIFDRFKREMTATVASNHHAAVSTANNAMAVANQARSMAAAVRQYEESVMEDKKLTPSPANQSHRSVFDSPELSRLMPSNDSSPPFAPLTPAATPPPTAMHQPTTTAAAAATPALRSTPDYSSALGKGSIDAPSLSPSPAPSPSASLQPLTLSSPTTKSKKTVRFAERIAEESLIHDEAIDGRPPLSDIIKQLQAGHTVLKHFTHAPPVPKLLFYSPTPLSGGTNDAAAAQSASSSSTSSSLGILYWVDPLVNRYECAHSLASMPLNTIHTLYAGKHTPALCKPDAVHIPDSVCFALASEHRCLEVQTASESERDLYLNAITNMLRQRNIAVHVVGKFKHDNNDEEGEDEDDETDERRSDEYGEEDENGTDDGDFIVHTDPGSSYTYSYAPPTLSRQDSRDDVDTSDVADDGNKSSAALPSPLPSTFATAGMETGASESGVSSSSSSSSSSSFSSSSSSQSDVERRQRAQLERQSHLAKLKAAMLERSAARKAAAAAAEAEAERQQQQDDEEDEQAVVKHEPEHEQQQGQEQEQEHTQRQQEQQTEADDAKVQPEVDPASPLSHSSQTPSQTPAISSSSASSSSSSSSSSSIPSSVVPVDSHHSPHPQTASSHRTDIDTNTNATTTDSTSSIPPTTPSLSHPASASASDSTTFTTSSSSSSSSHQAQAQATRAPDDDSESESRLASRQTDTDGDERQRSEDKAKDENEHEDKGGVHALPASSSPTSLTSALLEAEDFVSEEDEEDEEEEDDKPQWLRPNDTIVQLTLRAEHVPRLGVVSKCELVFHVSDVDGSFQSHLHVVDRSHLQGMDEDELAEYYAAHPDCCNAIFDVRFPAIDPSECLHRRLRLRIYDVLESSGSARGDNLVGEVSNITLHQLLHADQQHPLILKPYNPAKQSINDRMTQLGTIIQASGRWRKNARERAMAGLPPATYVMDTRQQNTQHHTINTSPHTAAAHTDPTTPPLTQPVSAQHAMTSLSSPSTSSTTIAAAATTTKTSSSSTYLASSASTSISSSTSPTASIPPPASASSFVSGSMLGSAATLYEPDTEDDDDEAGAEMEGRMQQRMEVAQTHPSVSTIARGEQQHSQPTAITRMSAEEEWEHVQQQQQQQQLQQQKDAPHATISPGVTTSTGASTSTSTSTSASMGMGGGVAALSAVGSESGSMGGMRGNGNASTKIGFSFLDEEDEDGNEDGDESEVVDEVDENANIQSFPHTGVTDSTVTPSRASSILAPPSSSSAAAAAAAPSLRSPSISVSSPSIDPSTVSYTYTNARQTLPHSHSNTHVDADTDTVTVAAANQPHSTDTLPAPTTAPVPTPSSASMSTALDPLTDTAQHDVTHAYTHSHTGRSDEGQSESNANAILDVAATANVTTDRNQPHTPPSAPVALVAVTSSISLNPPPASSSSAVSLFGDGDDDDLDLDLDVTDEELSLDTRT